VGWVGLGWVKKNGPMPISALARCRTGKARNAVNECQKSTTASPFRVPKLEDATGDFWHFMPRDLFIDPLTLYMAEFFIGAARRWLRLTDKAWLLISVPIAKVTLGLDSRWNRIEL